MRVCIYIHQVFWLWFNWKLKTRNGEDYRLFVHSFYTCLPVFTAYNSWYMGTLHKYTIWENPPPPPYIGPCPILKTFEAIMEPNVLLLDLKKKLLRSDYRRRLKLERYNLSISHLTLCTLYLLPLTFSSRSFLPLSFSPLSSAPSPPLFAHLSI